MLRLTNKMGWWLLQWWERARRDWYRIFLLIFETMHGRKFIYGYWSLYELDLSLCEKSQWRRALGSVLMQKRPIFHRSTVYCSPYYHNNRLFHVLSVLHITVMYKLIPTPFPARRFQRPISLPFIFLEQLFARVKLCGFYSNETRKYE